MFSRKDIDSFESDFPGIKFAVVVEEGLSLDHARDKFANLAGGSTDLSIEGQYVHSLKKCHPFLLETIDLYNPQTSLEEVFRLTQISPAGRLYVVLPKDQKILSSDSSMLFKAFDYIQEIRGEDICLFDDSASWILWISHGGGVGVYKTSFENDNSETKSKARVADAVPVTCVGSFDVKNLSDQPLSQLIGFLPKDLVASEVVFLPDVCPSQAPLPTGCVVRTSDPNWHKLAVSDCGCGMQLLRGQMTANEFRDDFSRWDSLGLALKDNRGRLGDLGGGNHFVDALMSYSDDSVYFLIHTGSRMESGLVDHLINKPLEFEREFDRVNVWARQNRNEVADEIEKLYGRTELVLDIAHNSFERIKSGEIIVRKGAVKAPPGTLTVLPSHMLGDVALIRATDLTKQSLCSLSHGTGRTMSRSEAKDLAEGVDFSELRRAIYIPEYVHDSSLRAEAPHCYRSLDSCLRQLHGLVEEVDRYAVMAYLGRL